MKEILIFMVRVVSDRQASMVSVITDCRRGKMHHFFVERIDTRVSGWDYRGICNTGRLSG